MAGFKVVAPERGNKLEGGYRLLTIIPVELAKGLDIRAKAASKKLETKVSLAEYTRQALQNLVDTTETPKGFKSDREESGYKPPKAERKPKAKKVKKAKAKVSKKSDEDDEDEKPAKKVVKKAKSKIGSALAKATKKSKAAEEEDDDVSVDDSEEKAA